MKSKALWANKFADLAVYSKGVPLTPFYNCPYTMSLLCISFYSGKRGSLKNVPLKGQLSVDFVIGMKL